MSATLPPPEVYRLVGQRIRAAREKRGLSQERLAERVNLTRASITNIEKGRQKLLLHTIYAFSEALSVSVPELMSISDIIDPVQTAEQVVPADLPLSARIWVVRGVVSAVKGQT